MALTVGQLKRELNDYAAYGDLVPTVAILPDGTHREIMAVLPADITGRYPAAGLVLGDIV
jgi:hypothetical protein